MAQAAVAAAVQARDSSTSRNSLCRQGEGHLAFALFSFVVPCRQFLARRDERIASTIARLRLSIGDFNLPPFVVSLSNHRPAQR